MLKNILFSSEEASASFNKNFKINNYTLIYVGVVYRVLKIYSACHAMSHFSIIVSTYILKYTSK